MREESLQFLKTLVNTPSPAGHKAPGQRVWLDYAAQFADTTCSDAYGNCVAVLNQGGLPRLMRAGHADEIAMSVNYIDAEGFIYVRKMGGVNAAIMKAQRVDQPSQPLYAFAGRDCEPEGPRNDSRAYGGFCPIAQGKGNV